MTEDNSKDLKVVAGVEKSKQSKGEEMLCRHQRLKKCTNQAQD